MMSDIYCEVSQVGAGSYQCQRCLKTYHNIQSLPLRAVCKTKRTLGEPVGLRPTKPPGGPGTELMGILSSMGIKAEETGCKCKSRAAALDTYGPAWARQNIEQIVSWLVEEAERRQWPLLGGQQEGRGLKRLLRRWAKKGAEFAARKLILTAIERAEAKAIAPASG